MTQTGIAGAKNQMQASDALARLHAQIEEVRLELARAQRDLFEAEAGLSSSHAAQLISANEKLVLSALRAQESADTASQAFEQASRSAEFDGLTDLPNRMLMLDRLEQAIVGARRRGTLLALLFVDIDNFKQINDVLGHAVGDDVLKIAARCLESSVREADTVSRHGGDEFLILLNGISQIADAALIADKIAVSLDTPKHLANQELRLRASIGMSIYPGDGDDAKTLIARADAAMYRSKRRGVGGHAFHGKPFDDDGDPPPLLPETLVTSSALHNPAWVDQQPWHVQLREANGHLVLAALDAQELQRSSDQARQRQTEFLAVLAHELRNPLGPIRAVAALLSRSGPSDMPRLQAVIERQVVHMARLVSDLLDLSRASTGKLRLQLQPVDMGDVIDAALDVCRPAMETRHQRFECHVCPGPLDVQGDRIRLTQVLNNLLENASKYTPEGGQIDLRVEIDDDALVLSVSDNGIGITASALPHIFDAFAQDAHAIGFNGVGLGIGLAVVKELVKEHGGTVVAHSTGAGHGSRFVVRLVLIGH